MATTTPPPASASPAIPPRTTLFPQLSPLSAAHSPHTPSFPPAKSLVSPISAVKPEIPPPDPRQISPAASASAATFHPPEPSTPTSYTITIPSCSAWFSWEEIHETERRILSEFFDGKSAARNPRVYKYYRDSIIRRFRSNPSRKITFTEARRGLVGDVGSIRRVFDFLEAWGLINYVPSAKPVTKEKRDVGEASEKKESAQKLCSNCRSVCSLACFATDKADIILCARCFVRGNYRAGLSSTDFKRVDISEVTKVDWTDKETLHLLEAILHYGEDWKKVAAHVGSRTEKECVARFIKLPFGEQFMGPSEVKEDFMRYENDDQVNTEMGGENVGEACRSKRRRLTPLADATNPIMAQVAFLSAMAGSEVAGAAAQAAIAALNEVDLSSISSQNGGSASTEINGGDNCATNGRTVDEVLKEAAAEAQLQLEKEQKDVEQSISDIMEVQMKEIQEKITHFEDVELRLQKERVQLRYMRDLLFADQLNLLQHKARLASSGSGGGQKIRATNDVTS